MPQDDVKKQVNTSRWVPFELPPFFPDPEANLLDLYGRYWNEYADLLRAKGMAELTGIESFLSHRIGDIESILNRLARERGLTMKLVSVELKFGTNQVVEIEDPGRDEEWKHTLKMLKLKLFVLRNVMWRYCVYGEKKGWSELDKDQQVELQTPSFTKRCREYLLAFKSMMEAANVVDSSPEAIVRFKEHHHVESQGSLLKMLAKRCPKSDGTPPSNPAVFQTLQTNELLLASDQDGAVDPLLKNLVQAVLSLSP